MTLTALAAVAFASSARAFESDPFGLLREYSGHGCEQLLRDEPGLPKLGEAPLRYDVGAVASIERLAWTTAEFEARLRRSPRRPVVLRKHSGGVELVTFLGVSSFRSHEIRVFLTADATGRIFVRDVARSGRRDARWQIASDHRSRVEADGVFVSWAGFADLANFVLTADEAAQALRQPITRPVGTRARVGALTHVGQTSNGRRVQVVYDRTGEGTTIHRVRPLPDERYRWPMSDRTILLPIDAPAHGPFAGRTIKGTLELREKVFRKHGMPWWKLLEAMEAARVIVPSHSGRLMFITQIPGGQLIKVVIEARPAEIVIITAYEPDPDTVLRYLSDSRRCAVRLDQAELTVADFERGVRGVP